MHRFFRKCLVYVHLSPILLAQTSSCSHPSTAATILNTTRQVDCDVIVAGGSTAALSLALSAAREGAKTCLVEPTNWPGGQLTAGGVPAVDFPWHSVEGYPVGQIGKQSENLTPELMQWLSAVGNPGLCSVSIHCFEPKNLLINAIIPAIDAESNLTVFRSAVVKRVETVNTNAGRTITAVDVVVRTPREGHSGYERLLSQSLPDWYSEYPSYHFAKTTIRLSSRPGRVPIVADTTEFGDILALSGASFLQGVETAEGSLTTNDDECGQAFVFPFAIGYAAQPVAESGAPDTVSDHPAFDFSRFSWEYVWRYRRLKGQVAEPLPGDITSQNWNPGNDYLHGYLLKSRADTTAEINDWKGGVNLTSLEAAERHAFAFFHWYRSGAPEAIRENLYMARELFGTNHGLSRIPYVRDTRRSIGITDYVLTLPELQGSAQQKTGKRFIDRVALGSYVADIHPMKSCSYPNHVYGKTETLPFYIPLRALTNRDVINLLVAGKTMAQSFMANAATRLHPIEFSTGTAAGVAAAMMVDLHLVSTRQLFAHLPQLQQKIRQYTPINWTVEGTAYPQPSERLEGIPGLVEPEPIATPTPTPEPTATPRPTPDPGPIDERLETIAIGDGSHSISLTLRASRTYRRNQWITMTGTAPYTQIREIELLFGGQRLTSSFIRIGTGSFTLRFKIPEAGMLSIDLRALLAGNGQAYGLKSVALRIVD